MVVGNVVIVGKMMIDVVKGVIVRDVVMYLLVKWWVVAGNVVIMRFSGK